MSDRMYVLIEIQPGKEQDFVKEIISKGLDSKAERIDLVHGAFDFVIILSGTRNEMDTEIMQMRKLPFVKRTETLIPFDLSNLEDVSSDISAKI
jgi:hypothetical protein